MKNPKTPQQKKSDSYSKDRRNAYGERGAHSRHSIRRRKRKVNRANRRGATTAIATLGVAVQADVADALQSKIESKRLKKWQKVPDVPLSRWIEGRLQRRSDLAIDDGASVADRIRRVRKNSGR